MGWGDKAKSLHPLQAREVVVVMERMGLGLAKPQSQGVVRGTGPKRDS